MTKPTAIVGAVLVVLGLVALVTGVLGPTLQGGPSEVERLQAAEYLSAASDMESAAALRDPEARRAALAATRDQYRASRDVVEESLAARERWCFWLKIVGGATALAGVGALLASKST